MTDDLLLSVDGGQTSTQSLLARRDGAILGRGTAGPCIHFGAADGAERNRTAIQDAIWRAHADAGLLPRALHAAVLAITTVRRNAPEIRLIEALAREVVQPRYLAVVPDYEANLAGASGGEAGVVVVAGGGAIAYGRSRDGTREGLAGGFGYLLGDDGSAWEIGRQAIIAAARASDGRGEPTALEDVVRRHFGLASVRDVTAQIYAGGFQRDRVSALAPRVSELAGSGDAAAGTIVAGAAMGLAHMALAVVNAVAEAEEKVPVYPTGGVFRAGPVILQPFAEAVHASRPGTEIRLPMAPPVAGGLILALRLSGEGPTVEWMYRLRQGIERAGTAVKPEVTIG